MRGADKTQQTCRNELKTDSTRENELAFLLTWAGSSSTRSSSLWLALVLLKGREEAPAVSAGQGSTSFLQKQHFEARKVPLDWSLLQGNLKKDLKQVGHRCRLQQLHWTKSFAGPDT